MGRRREYASGNLAYYRPTDVAGYFYHCDLYLL